MKKISEMVPGDTAYILNGLDLVTNIWILAGEEPR